MKFNWGFGIVVFIALFMTFILSLVYQCSKQQVDLVSEKYYEKGLNYQQQVDELNNAAAMNEKLSVQFNKEQSTVEIHYPANSDHTTLTGNINFFKPDDAKLDFNIRVESKKENIQLVPVSRLKKGWWKVQVSWASSGTSYYKEERILIN